MITFRIQFLPLLAACTILTFSASLHAAEVKYPESGSGITMTIPDSWTVTKKGGNFLLVAPDGKVSITLSKAIAESPTTAGETAKQFAGGAGMEGVEVKELPDSEEGGNKLSIALALGKMKGADFVATVMRLTTAQGAKLAIIAFGEKKAVLDNKEVDEIMNSMK